MLRAFARYFENSSGYKDYKGISYFDSLAYTAQEFLYTKRAEDRYDDYNMINRIKLYDLMTLVAYFIKASTTDFGRATITGYIDDISQKKYSYQQSEEIEYTKDKALLITNASRKLVMSILWVAYVYIKFRVDCEDGKDETWNNAEKTLSELLEEYYPYNKSNYKESFLIKNIIPALEVFVAHWYKNNKIRKSDQQENNHSKDDLYERNKDVLFFQQQLTDAQKRTTELEQIVGEEEQDTYESIGANQKIRMEIAYRLMRKAGMNPHTIKKQRAAEFMSMLLDIKSDNARKNDAQTCATYISARLNDTKKNAFVLEKNKDITNNIKSRAQELGIDITLDDDPT